VTNRRIMLFDRTARAPVPALVRCGLSAEAFYTSACGMTRVGVDPNYDSLTYFEFSPLQAEAYLEKEDGK
jgi:hypothetical protein